MLISFEINPLKSWNWVERENAKSYYYKKWGTVKEQKQKISTPKIKSESVSIISIAMDTGSSAQFHQDMNQINTFQRKCLITSYLAHKRGQSR